MAPWKTYATLQFLKRESTLAAPIFHQLLLLPLNPGYNAAASCDECEKVETVIFSYSEEEEEEEEEVAGNRSGEQMASPSVWSV